MGPVSLPLSNCDLSHVENGDNTEPIVVIAKIWFLWVLCVFLQGGNCFRIALCRESTAKGELEWGQ